VEALGGALSALWSGISSAASSAWNGLAGIASGAFNAVKSAIMGPLEAAVSFVQGILDRIRNLVSNIGNAISSAVSSLNPFASSAMVPAVSGGGTGTPAVAMGFAGPSGRGMLSVSGFAASAFGGVPGASPTYGGSSAVTIQNVNMQPGWTAADLAREMDRRIAFAGGMTPR
jgi:hypothetical protein